MTRKQTGTRKSTRSRQVLYLNRRWVLCQFELISILHLLLVILRKHHSLTWKALQDILPIFCRMIPRTVFSFIHQFGRPLGNRKQPDLGFSPDDSMQPIRNSCSEVFLEKVVQKTSSEFTGEHTCGALISVKLLCNFIEITLRHGCSPVNLLYSFRAPFPKNTSGQLLLNKS